MHPPPMAKKLLSQPRLTSEESLAHGWNPEDLSANMYVRAENLSTVVRRPVANSTDGARGRLSYTRGLHAWDVHWPRGERGSHAIVGVATGQQV